MKKLYVYKKLRIFLKPFAYPYKWIMRLRRYLYNTHLDQYIPKCPCVAVGNIAWGGAGKTPFTSWIVSWAEQNNLKVAVITRGYKGDHDSKPLLVETNTPVKICGDEALMLSKLHPNAKIIVSAKRKEGIEFALNNFSPDLCILDDAMQHLAVKANNTIVLLKPSDLSFEWDAVIPGGTWREDSSALHSATAFGMKIQPEQLSFMEPLIVERLVAYNKPFFPFTLFVKGLVSLSWYSNNNNLNISDGDFCKNGYVLVSGIAEPELVEETACEFLKCKPTKHFMFEDHHKYSPKDVENILSYGLPVICTEKDAVKLSYYQNMINANVWAIRVEIKFLKSLFCEENFTNWWSNWWENFSKDFKNNLNKIEKPND